jgi:hypothetical protein
MKSQILFLLFLPLLAAASIITGPGGTGGAIYTVQTTSATTVTVTNSPTYQDTTNIVQTLISSSDSVFATDDGTNITLLVTNPVIIPTLDWSLLASTNYFEVDTNTVIVTGGGTAAANQTFFWNATANCYTNPVNTRYMTNVLGTNYNVSSAFPAPTAGYFSTRISTPWPWGVLAPTVSPGAVTRYRIRLKNFGVIADTLASTNGVTQPASLVYSNNTLFWR